MSPTKVIVAIDIGSSSLRTTAYAIAPRNDGETASSSPPTIQALEDCRVSRTVRSVEPNTGKIQLLGNSSSSCQDESVARDDNGKKSLMENLDDCIDELLDRLRARYCDSDGFQVVAVGFSTFVMNLVGVDSRGNVVGDEASISYACNAPNVAKKCRTLRSQLTDHERQEMYQKTGAPIHSAYALPQLLDINDNNNPKYQNTIHKWQSIASICLSRWTGTPFLPISFSEASWTGLLNFRTCQYESSVVGLLPPACQQSLPTLTDFDDKKNNLYILQDRRDGSAKNPYWERWPELRGQLLDGSIGCRLYLGLGDGACANIGSKCSTASRIAVTIGTSAAARVCLPLPITICDENNVSSNDADDEIVQATPTTIRVPHGLFCYRINRAHVLLGGALTDGGSVVEWISDLLNLSSSPESFTQCMSKVETLLQTEYSRSTSAQKHDKQHNNRNVDPPAGLTVVPFLSGERSTGYRDGATGAILGLTRDTTAAHLLKSCLEGVTLRLNAVVQLIRQAMKEMNEDFQQQQQQTPCIVASGKALEVNALWRQMLSDCSGLEVIMDHETEEGTSRGVALAVAVALNETAAATFSTGSGSNTVLFTNEALRVSLKSETNGSGGLHWRQATAAQEMFLDTISPLFNS